MASRRSRKPSHGDRAWRELRAEARKRLDPFCYFCGQWIDVDDTSNAPEACTVHHIESVAESGKLIPYGGVRSGLLALAHRSCNTRDGVAVRRRVMAARKRQQLLDDR